MTQQNGRSAAPQEFIPLALTVDASMIARLVEVVQIAADAGLAVVPTFVVIDMSGLIAALSGRGTPAIMQEFGLCTALPAAPAT